MENVLRVRNEYRKAAMDSNYPGMPEQWAEQQGILSAAWDIGKELLLLAAETAERGGGRYAAKGADQVL